MERVSLLTETVLRKLVTVSLKHCKKATKIFTAQINPMPVLYRKQYFEDDIIK